VDPWAWHNHRITEWFELEGTVQFHPPAKGRDPFHQPRVLKVLSNLALNPAREGAATASLGNLGQGLTTITVKNSFLISNLNLPSFSLKPSSLVLSPHALVKRPSPACLQAPSGTGSCSKVSLEPSLLQAEQPQLSQPFTRKNTIPNMVHRRASALSSHPESGTCPSPSTAPSCQLKPRRMMDGSVHFFSSQCNKYFI